MVLKHNKKRNSGMLVEFFANYVSVNVLKKNDRDVELAKQLWSKYTSKGTELYKEMVLFNSLHQGSYDNKEVAYSFLTQIKKAARSLDSKKLNEEKTKFVREINAKLNKDQKFFEKQIRDYIELATIQVWLNSCANKTMKEGTINPAMMELEDKILKHMCKEKEPATYPSKLMNMKESEVDRLVVKVMKDKMDEKFSSNLTENQKSILQQYVFANNFDRLSTTLDTLKEETVHLIDKEFDDHKMSVKQKNRLKEIKNLLEYDYKDTTKINDSTVAFYMTVSKLNEELKDRE